MAWISFIFAFSVLGLLSTCIEREVVWKLYRDLDIQHWFVKYWWVTWLEPTKRYQTQGEEVEVESSWKGENLLFEARGSSMEVMLTDDCIICMYLYYMYYLGGIPLGFWLYRTSLKGGGFLSPLFPSPWVLLFWAAGTQIPQQFVTNPQSTHRHLQKRHVRSSQRQIE